MGSLVEAFRPSVQGGRSRSRRGGALLPFTANPLALAKAVAFVMWLLGAGPVAGREWHFDVAVDGFTVGTYDVSVDEEKDVRRAHGQMRLRASFLGFTAASYEQRQEEVWRGDCLARIDTRTTEKDTVSVVSGRAEGDAFVIDGPAGPQRLPACVMSFAYWNPSVLRERNLINTQTGAWTPVTVHPLGAEPFRVRGEMVDAMRSRVDTARNRIEVWYATGGDWVGLRSTSHTGHVLSYRLK